MFVPAGLLLVSLAIGAVTVFVALDDPGFAVEEDYYQRGLAFDDELTRQRASAELGWSAAIEAEVRPGQPSGPLRLRLRDATGGPLAGASVRVRGFSIARSVEQTEAMLAEREPGLYAVEFPLQRPGFWEFQVHAEAGGATWDGVLRVLVAVASDGG